ncbi:MAG: HAMP domain-containing sensor histidine kinase [Bacteroidota bacterium]
MRISLQSKIWLTVCSIVLLFSFFILIYFPAQQEKYLLKNYNKEVQNLAGTVALGVKIALTEQNFEGVQTALDFVKNDPHLRFVSMAQTDTLWNAARTGFKMNRVIFKTFPENAIVAMDVQSNDSIIVKSAPFQTNIMSGEILLGFSTDEIIQSKQQIRLTSIIVSITVFIIGIFIGFWLARKISVPVLALRDAALRVGEGDRSQILKSSAHDEIGDLTIAFNKMVTDLKQAEDKIANAQAQLIHAEKMASLGQMSAGIAHEIQNPLNFINNFSDLNIELIDEVADAQSEVEKKELLADVKRNLEKISLHGTRADSIVKNMLLHSRIGSSEKQLTNINAVCEEYLQLAYHGIRAKNIEFNCTINKEYGIGFPQIPAIPQDIGRVVLNLLNNSFYAMDERRQEDSKEFKPVLNFSTSHYDGKIIIRIRDNGKGIPESIKAKIFEPFFTTKPTGEGTGLGLSICYDIIKVHQGDLKVESKENEFTEFVITLPAA